MLSIRSGNIEATVAPKVAPYENLDRVCQSSDPDYNSSCCTNPSIFAFHLRQVRRQHFIKSLATKAVPIRRTGFVCFLGGEEEKRLKLITPRVQSLPNAISEELPSISSLNSVSASRSLPMQENGRVFPEPLYIRGLSVLSLGTTLD